MAHDFSTRSLRVDGKVYRSQEELDAAQEEEKSPFASESAEKLAAEHGLDPSSIEATGKTGITKGDVEKAIEG